MTELIKRTLTFWNFTPKLNMKCFRPISLRSLGFVVATTIN